MQETSVRPTDDFEYYQSYVFYRSFDLFACRENSKIADDERVNWIGHLKRRYQAFNSAFVFSCGNGWVERLLYQEGLIRRVTAFDVLPRYVDEARSEASTLGLPATYFVADGNTYDPNGLRCDVVINSGAMHHIAHINRFTAVLADICAGGYYVGLDYTGPHRNQYSMELWQKVLRVHAAMPPKYRIALLYPHVPTMLAGDPSEAVHSELQMEVLQRHFNLEQHVRLGGGVAHPLLFNNYALHRDQHTAEGRAVLEMILQADEEAIEEVPDGNLFTFFVGHPKAEKPSPEWLEVWQAEEDAREAAAAANVARYYEPTPLELIYNDIAWQLYHNKANADATLQTVRDAARSDIAALQASTEADLQTVRSAAEKEIAAFQRSTSWRITQPLRSLRTTLRSSRQ